MAGSSFLKIIREHYVQSVKLLPDNHITAICEDRDNNLWFGTYKRLSRFSGGKMVVFMQMTDWREQSNTLSIMRRLWRKSLGMYGEDWTDYGCSNHSFYSQTVWRTKSFRHSRNTGQASCVFSATWAAQSTLKTARIFHLDNTLVGPAAVNGGWQPLDWSNRGYSSK